MRGPRTATGRIDRTRSSDLMELAVDRGPVPWQVGAVLRTVRELDADGLARALADRVAAVPRLRRRLVRTPPLCGRPVWVDDAGFAVGRHVRAVRCPAPGDDDALYDLAVGVVGTRLPSDRSPWAAVVVSGPAGGGGAVVLVMHHVLADGIGGLAALGALVDGAPRGADAGFPRRPPSARELFLDALHERLRSLAHLPRGLRRLRDGVAALRATRPPRAPRTSLNRPVGPRRALRVLHTDLATVRAAAHRHGGTVGDVVLTAVGGALGALTARRGETVGDLVVSVPVSARRSTDPGRLGNAVGTLPIAVPTAGTPQQRLAAVARRTAKGRAAPRAASAALLDPAFRLVAAAGVLPWLLDHQHLVSTVVTDLRGPAAPVALLGTGVSAMVPVVSTVGDVPVVVAALSYAGVLVLSVVADPDTCPELDRLVADVRAELDALAGPDGTNGPGDLGGPGVGSGHDHS
ncbi:wax ester/triacylglycerol synthase domain-containing protein [Pseudonocardia alni]|uniref:wax ester/triacylglycerol synthase domain-containing protein n=1 Tax=Pseudonocardia alni TaxID=33907 RepID=UPI003327C6AA